MGAGHDHGPPAADGHSRAFALGVTLNLGFVVVEAGFGFATGSVALLADAGHNLSDVASLLIAWGASVAAARPAAGRYTYGFKSSTILAALANAALLLVAVGVILVETVRRLGDPQPVPGATVMVVAGVGVVVNAITAMLFLRGRHGDLNVRGAYLHMLADAAVSAGVVLAGLLILLTGAWWIDPVASLIVVAAIAWGSWGLARDSLRMGLLAVPEGIDEGAVRALLGGLPGVARVHDLHIWPMSTTETALTAHLVVPGDHPGDEFLRDAAERLAHDHGIAHATLQVERDEACATGC